MASPTLYQSLFHYSAEAFLLTTPTGKILEANPAAASLLGYTKEELAELGEFGMADHTDPAFHSFMSSLLQTGKSVAELNVKHKDGHAFPAKVSAVRFNDNNAQAYLVLTIHDISHVRMHEDQLRVTALNLQMILDNTEELFIILDRELKVTNFNKATAERSKLLLGTPFVKGQSIFDSVSEDRIPFLQQLYAEVLQGAVKNTSMELFHPEKGKTVIDIRYSPIYHEEKIIGVIVNIRDTTAAIKSSQELFAANERFFYAAKATNDAIWDWDIEQDEVLRVGNGLMNLFGYDPLVANNERDFWITRVHPEDIDRMISRRTNILNDPAAIYWEDEYRFLRADQTYAYVFDKGYIIRDAQQKAIRMIGATQDRSQQKESEALLLELNTRLKKRADELSSSNVELERFAYVASHDLQEPLRMITSFLQLLKKRYAGNIDDTADQYIHFAMDGADRMKTLIMDLLEYSRVGSTSEKLDMVNVDQLLNDLTAVFGKTCAEKNARINIISSSIPPVKGNRTQLFQLFQNLVGNGLKYNKSPEPLIEISYENMDAFHCFKVRDNGIGIDPVFHEKVFVLFQRLHSKTEYAGTGIGLAICKKIVDKHGGRIWIESQPNEGSCFCFTLLKSNN